MCSWPLGGTCALDTIVSEIIRLSSAIVWPVISLLLTVSVDWTTVTATAMLPAQQHTQMVCSVSVWTRRIMMITVIVWPIRVYMTALVSETTTRLTVIVWLNLMMPNMPGTVPAFRKTRRATATVWRVVVTMTIALAKPLNTLLLAVVVT